MTHTNNPVRSWMDRDPRRHAPEVDFGTCWTRESDPDTQWAVTWNSGTGELYTHSHDDIEVLGTFDTAHDVRQALPDWARHAVQPGGLDWARRLTVGAEFMTTNDPDVAVYGIVLGTDGTHTRLLQPVEYPDVSARIGGLLDVVTINPSEKVIMWVDDLGHSKHLPVNPTATVLYGTGWPIVGDVVITNDDDRPLPTELVRRLTPDININDPDPEVAALDWDDHLTDRERDYDLDDGIDVDAMLSHHDPRPELDVDHGDIDL